MRQTITHMVDDLDQTSEAVETFRFSYGGKQYELDLNAENAEQFRAAVEPWVQVATPQRRTGKRAASRAASSARASTGRRHQATARRNQQIRQWAQTVGITVSDRGRIPQSVIDQYDAAHQSPSTTQPESADSGPSGSGRSNGRKTAANKTTKTAANKTVAKKSNGQEANGQKTAAKSAGKRATTKQSS